MCFVCKDDIEWEELDWGDLGWIVFPGKVPEATKLTVMDVKVHPGGGHDFHKHPDQEEVIFVREGSIEQWVREESKQLGPGDTAFIPADTVHASFVAADASEPARLLVVLGPSHGPQGYEAVDMTGEAPWSTLRS